MSNLIDSIGNAAEKIGNVFDKNFTTKEEILEHIAPIQRDLIQARQNVLLAEANGNRMQRSWRPFLMYLFGLIIGYDVLIAPILLYYFGIPKPILTPEFWEVLRLSIGGYVIARSGEKILPEAIKTVQNIRNRRNERRKNKGSGLCSSYRRYILFCSKGIKN